MAKHITRWTPDTHPDVTIEYEWDDSAPEDERVHTFKRFVKEPSHARFTGTGQQKFAKLTMENQRKNIALAEILTALPDSEKVREVQADGQEVLRFKREPKWRIDEIGEVEFDLDDRPLIRSLLRNKLKTNGARIK